MTTNRKEYFKNYQRQLRLKQKMFRQAIQTQQQQQPASVLVLTLEEKSKKDEMKGNFYFIHIFHAYSNA
jgi:hypothetical protein